ncbi:hypothetical protein GQ53DRAFT_112024 [Thozetella sp. PMI_491]|nr:hypothetical protein GQ53DRAFT_112024 [Thozetella sp. PMI_491]
MEHSPSLALPACTAWLFASVICDGPTRWLKRCCWLPGTCVRCGQDLCSSALRFSVTAWKLRNSRTRRRGALVSFHLCRASNTGAAAGGHISDDDNGRPCCLPMVASHPGYPHV